MQTIKRLFSLRLAAICTILAVVLCAAQYGKAEGVLLALLMASSLMPSAQRVILGAETLVGDVAVVPETFLPYSVEVTAELSRLVQSGLLETNADFAARADIGFDVKINAASVGIGGQFTSMPFWNDLSGNDEVLSDVTSLTTAKMTSSNELAVIHNRAKAWSHNDLTSIVAASDPSTALGQRLGAYWERRLQAMTLSTLAGIFATSGMAANTSDIYLPSGSTFTDENYLTGNSFIVGKQLLGDAKDKLVAIIMHSATEAQLAARDLIDFIPDSEGKLTIKTFQGLEVILDDGMTVETINSALVYSTFLFAKGAFGYGVGAANGPIYGAAPGSTWALERARETLAGQNIFVNRQRSILHPRGFKFLNATMAGISPTNTELADPTNWLATFQLKNIPMVRIRHNVDLTP